MLAHEVNPFSRALRTHALKVVAIHSHMPFNQLRILLLHCYSLRRLVGMPAGPRNGGMR
ncbi:DUF1259 domain-containing protein [Hymenobacter lucidus]|uniref:DUF1259 domain-containing protein n=1 Tax=Hymenobacter lucidus TaxID=2880930 RepID=A0ABS8AQS9_9BACT|nr:DUF1259 domain-containing protein [Hymenobacter lucidus]